MNRLIRALRALANRADGPDRDGCILCGLSGPGCLYHGKSAS